MKKTNYSRVLNVALGATSVRYNTLAKSERGGDGNGIRA